MNEYDLLDCKDVPTDEIQQYFDEFNKVQECKVLRQLYEMGVDEWKSTLIVARNTIFFAMYVNNRIVGIGRISHKPTHYSSGNIGYGIRPSERCKGYGSTLLSLLANEAEKRNIPLRCCVESTNIPSMKCMEKCLFFRNGIQYNWDNNRIAYEFIKEVQHG